MSILTVKNLTKQFTSGFWPFKKYHTHTAVNGISFELHKGEILGLLGPNGAGKTTTIQMLLDLLTPTSGSIAYFGQNLAQHRIAILKKVGYASGYEKLPLRLTVMENLDIVGRIYAIPAAQRAAQIQKLLHFFGIWKLRNHSIGALSAGQATRVMLVKAFIAQPEIVLLDEPTASLDPDVAQEVRHFILAESKERAVSILITSHNMNEVTELCDRVLVLKNGAIIANNTPELLAQSIAKTRIHLTISSSLDAALAYVTEAALFHTVESNRITVEIDEDRIAHFLMQLSQHAIMYSQISIDKPSLEDYFISVAKEREQI